MDNLTREHKLMAVAVAMGIFIVSLFLDWTGITTALGDSGANGTEPNSWWLALVLAVVAGGIAAAEALNFPAPVRWVGMGLMTLCAGLVCFWALVHFLDATEGPLSPKIGAWIGLAASAVGTAIGASVWNRER